MRCLLIGNYGVANFGDEALKEYVLQTFPQIEWTVVTATPSGPGEVPRLPFGVHSFFRTPWWRTVRAIRSCDAMVFGGGSLFTDSESVFACWMWWSYAAISRLFRRPVFLAFQGIGPFRTKAGAKLARTVLRHASFISVRDSKSLERAVLAGTSGKSPVRVVETADPVWSMFAADVHRNHDGRILALIPRANSGDRFMAAATKALSDASYGDVRILSLEPDADSEQQVIHGLCSQVSHAVSVHPIRSIDDMRNALDGSSLVIAERYHGALAAIALGIPTEIVSQAPGDKLDVLRGLTAGDLLRVRALVKTGEQELQKSLNML